MHVIRLMSLLAICLALLLFPQVSSAAQVDAQTRAFTPEQRTEIVHIIREALKSDPSILRDGVTTLQADENRKQADATRASIDKVRLALTDTPGDPVTGNLQGEKTLVEFYDLQCPYCRRMLPVIHELVVAEPKLRLVYKDIPIEGFGSEFGARAVLAAQKQGGYLKLQEAIMTGPAEITEESVQEATNQIGLDWARLRHDMDDPSIQARISANLELSKSLGVQGTPTYVVGGTMFSGAMSLPQFQSAIDTAWALR